MITLGDALGPLTYFGSCPRCGRQHMSTHDRVLDLGNGSLACERCAPEYRYLGAFDGLSLMAQFSAKHRDDAERYAKASGLEIRPMCEARIGFAQSGQ